jgi:3-phosphoshikimate 1-carboxyvinyltransferase
LNLFAKPSASISGEVICPGDKSISQRAVILGSLLNEDIAIEGFLNGEDPISTANALNAIGSSITINGTSVIIEKRNTPFKKPETEVDLGNSGTGMRLMMGLISSLNIEATLVGDESLTKRPMLRIANPLNEMGASIACNGGKPPVKISPGKILDNYTYEMPIASAQVKSGIILSALAANKSVTVIEKHPTRNHTERMISHFQGKIESIPHKAGNKISYTPSGLIASKSYEVVGDFSSAAFLIVAGLIAKESNIVIKNVGLNPTRFGLIDVLISMGGFIEIKNQKLTSNEEVGDIYVRSSSLRGISISGDVIPNIIDEIPILSIAAAFADGETSISDAEELRVKESDRLQAISDGLSKININHELFKDGIKIAGSAKDIEVSPEIDSHGDHRIAMSFLIASLRSTNGVFVKDCKNIFTSFPNFIEVMKTLGIGVHER